ncbi:MAG: CopG family transcriptional regulator [Alphaproteobacteria bacterium]
MATPSPDPVSTLDELDEEAEARAVAKARAEIAAGQGVPHEKVKKWLLKLRNGKSVPPPCE